MATLVEVTDALRCAFLKVNSPKTAQVPKPIRVPRPGKKPEPRRVNPGELLMNMMGR